MVAATAEQIPEADGTPVAAVNQECTEGSLPQTQVAGRAQLLGTAAVVVFGGRGADTPA